MIFRRNTVNIVIFMNTRPLAYQGELVSISPSRSGRLLVTYLEKGEKGVKWVMYQGEEASLRC